MTKQGNFRIIIEPVEPRGEETEGRWKGYCEEIVASLQRHVDDIRHIYWESDTLCKFCDNIWEVQPHDSGNIPKGQPLCCEEARKEWERRQKEKEKP